MKLSDVRKLRHPIRNTRLWREARAEARIAWEKDQDQFELFHGFRTPLQVCPRGCGFSERGRRDLVVRTGITGRANVTASIGFETSHCPNDGATLVERCTGCKEPVFAPVVDRCEFCGVPQPWAEERRAGTERASLRLWRPNDSDLPPEEESAHAPALRIYRSATVDGDGEARASGIWVIDGDIANLAVDAVISNDDTDGQMWAQSARSIKSAAGDGIERLAQAGKPFPLGHAWTTTAGNLRQMRKIIHIASMSRYGKAGTETVEKCLTAALELAVENEFESVGLTAFGTGPAAGIDRDEWFEVFARTAVDFLSGPGKMTDRKVPLAIVLVRLEPPNFEKEVTTLRRAARDAWVEFNRPIDGMPELEQMESAHD